MDTLDDIYTPIQNFLVDKLNYDDQKVIINYQNTSKTPKLPYIGLYIESFDIEDDIEQEHTESGLLITSSQTATMYIDFYGDTSSDVIKLKKLLKTDLAKAELRNLGISILSVSNSSSFSKIEQQNEHLERYQLLLTLSMTSSFIDETSTELTEVEMDLEFTKDGLYTGNIKPKLDDIVEFIK